MDKKFKWTELYMELATALLKYKNNRGELLEILKEIYLAAGMNYPFKERGIEPYDDICPFTVFGSFNRGITHENRGGSNPPGTSNHKEYCHVLLIKKAEEKMI